MLFRLLGTFSGLSYLSLIALTSAVAFLSCLTLLSQAVRTSASRSFLNNYDTITIGGAYALILIAAVIVTLNRRIAVRIRLHRISKSYKPLRKGDVPKAVYHYYTQEYARSCLIAHASLPKDVYRPGWGRPGTPLEGVRFRRSLQDTIKVIDQLARQVLPSQPLIKPNLRMLLQFRFLIPLLPQDDYQLTPLHYYDSIIEIARYSVSEPTEEEYLEGMHAFTQIQTCLEEYKLGLLEDASNSSTQWESH